MTTTYHLNANELTADLIRSVKAAFKDKTIDITVSEALDETEYLMSSEANRKHLDESLRALKAGEGITMTVEEFVNRYGL